VDDAKFKSVEPRGKKTAQFPVPETSARANPFRKEAVSVIHPKHPPSKEGNLV
jgi:hypothetical protein